MTTFTDKELIKEIKERISSLDVRDNIERRAYEIALTSLESEPVAWADNEELLDIESIGCGYLLPYPPNKDVDPCRVIPLYRVPSTQIAPEAIENAIEYIRCIAFHINEDDYHGKHIAHFMRQALTWLEGDSYRDGNCPVTLDAWISCSERMPDTKTAVLVAREFDRKGDWRMKWATYIPGHPDANDGWLIPGASWKPSHWIPLPEPPQEAK
ncbi:DUF551 domain-containing protein [Escherichia coli O121]|nr:DUF551 domain-containing protein [Escherichia coli O121]